jgi:iron complex outermembrane recepter protein
VALPGFANNAVPERIDALKRMSFEELMNVEITSVSRTEESIRDAAAAVAVVTRETIRRSGAATLPDSLRLVPGIHVGEQTASTWAVSARGFSSVTSEKLLVMSDTRSIYTPLFSGVFWDSQDYLLEDVERVEVIRGPGATLWGSNAVNGVINVTTRSARDTHGAYVEAGFGTFDRMRVGARYGAETEGGVSYRVFGKYLDRNATENSTPLTEDDWQLGHVGFRADWDGSPRDSFTVQGDAYAGEIGQLAPSFNIIGRPGPAPPLEVENNGGNILARWRHRTDDGSDLQLRAYYDYTHRNDPAFGDTLNTFDIDLQQRFTFNRHEVIWGVGYRLMGDHSRTGEIFALDPEDSNDQLFSGFIQDQVALADSLHLTLGTKLEHNDFSGFEWQPSVRLAWAANLHNTLWTSVSRAVRVPTRIERDVAVDILDPAANPGAQLLGSDEFESEELIAYEAGYRWRPLAKLSFDLALFYNDYEKLASLELIPEPFIDPDDGRIIFPVINVNLTEGRTWGAELLVEWEPIENWLLTASCSHINMELDALGQDNNRGEWLEGATPRNLAGLRSLLTLGERFEIDGQFRYLSGIRLLPADPTGAGIDAYSELDLRLGWRVSESWTVSLLGQNLLHDDHVEFGVPASRGRLERAAYLKADWRL